MRRALLVLCLVLAGCGGGTPRAAPTVRPSATPRPTFTAVAPNSPTPAPTVTPILFATRTPASTPAVARPSPTAAAGYTCDQCIKGNISSAGEKIYHLPACRDYARTEIDTSKGERWFSSEAEALAAGWRKAESC